MSSQKIKSTYGLHVIISAIILLVFWLMPPIAPVTPLGMRILGILFSVIYAWMFIDTIWPSLIGIILLGISGYMPVDKAITTALGNPLVNMILYIMILTGAISEAGLCDYVAKWFLTRKINNGRPWVFTTMILVASYVLSVMTLVTSSLFLLYPILYSMFEQFKLKKEDAYVKILLISVAMAGTLGFATTPYKGALPAMFNNYANITGTSIDYFPYMVVAVILSLVSILAMVVVIKYILRPDISAIKNINYEQLNKEPLQPLTKKQMILLGALVFYMIWVLMPSILPQGVVRDFMNNMQNGIAILLVALGCALKIEGEPIIHFQKVISKYAAWSVILIVASAICIGNALTAEGTGIIPLLEQITQPIFEGKSILVFTILMIVISFVLTNLCNNMVIGMLMIPIFYLFTQQMNTSSLPIAILVFFITCIAMITPSSSPVGAILHGNSQWLSAKDIYKYATVFCIVTLLVTIIVGLPVVSLIVG
ncbi:SLC13 family permease [Niameybacter massiliensis]|uniref:SLC13 family permease n=1 Tax=Holtiella tumoricola TaxID=3018743 RepID=A0AA42IZY4_9FIRM|nr:SLC13 family permease [Holtiella tumoricola]MDA3730907.1 SLC13 family permease [Holtiella tumoricola]